MEKTLEELNKLAKEYGFGGAHNAITCAKGYCAAYSEYLDKYNSIKDVLVSIKGILPDGLNELIDVKLKENNIYLTEDK
jgi:hypothetical protein